MRYGPDHKKRTRERVLKEAASVLRADGPPGVAVAGIMARSGLTHGGFYAHFASKDELLALAIERCFEEIHPFLAEAAEGKSPAEGLRALIAFYVSETHRDRREAGCPLPALASDLPRQSPDARRQFELGVENLFQLLADRLSALGRPAPDELALSVVSEMVGAVALARAVADESRSCAILAASRTAIMRRLGLNSDED